jgi:hypothetical protein
MKNEFEYKGIFFSEGTPIKLADELIRLKESKTRIILDYGDVKTGKSWEEVYGISGRIGKSTGTKPILLLIYNSNSLGGCGLLTDCILTIKESKGKRLIYIH